jgi:exopolysaccharide biosynthesis predicted pyruvyltransferase EpsI
MRIAIITHPAYTNFGGILQAYALQIVLQRMGHQVSKIELPYHYVRMTKVHRFLSICKQIIKKYVLNNQNVIIDLDNYGYVHSLEAMENTRKFAEKHLHIIVTNNMKSLEGKFDCFIVGSDQVWRYGGNSDGLKCYFLSFTNGWKIKRIAYAASFGLDRLDYPDDLVDECKSLVQSFNAVSVREKSGVDICKNNFNIEAVHVLDPTMLLDANDYASLFQNMKIKETANNKLLYYILDETDYTNKIVDTLTQFLGISSFSINAKCDNTKVYFDWRVQPPVENWLRGFYDASFVVTDSFHGTVFSIIFNKPFVTLGNEHRGMDRFNSLLSTFGLNNRLITNTDNLQEIVNKPIDWQEVNNKRAELKKISLDFIYKSL